MARFRVYIKPFDDSGSYLSDFIEVTKDVIQLGSISQGIDNTEFDVGIVRNNGLTIVLRNDEGYYNEADNIKSIFRFKRKNSIVKITWDARDHDLIAGFFNAGEEILGGEEEIFRGVLNEISSASDIDKQLATFKILGFESLLNEIETPFDDISNGDDFSEILLDAINQAPFNELVTVSPGNISLNTDLAIDVKDPWENKTVGDILKDLLLGANSVLYLKNNTVYATGRTASADLKFTFYGQASINGIENIINVPKIRDGLNRMFNYWTWTDTSSLSKDDSSITTYGIRRKDMKLSIIDDASTSKINTILANNRAEFAFPKVELELETPIWYTTLALQILDRVKIDYPTIYTPADNNVLPRYGLSNYGAVRYPYGQWSLTIDTERRFKILSKKIDTNKQTITFGLREI